MANKNDSPGEFKYIQVAEALEKLIQNEVLAIGDKLPSIRILSEEYGISLGTALQSYYHLEGKGLVEARPKSGYYVRFNNKRLPTTPAVVQQAPIASDVSIEEMIENVFKNKNAKDLIDISQSAPAVELLPTAKLNKSVVWALRNDSRHVMEYEDIHGYKDLRNQVAKLCFNWGGKINPDDVIVTAGCMEALFISLKAVTGPGDIVAVESPTFFGIFRIIESLGLKAMEISTDPQNGVDLQDLEWKIKRFGIKACLFVTNFNNPLGSLMPDAKKKELVGLISKYRIPLIEDDIYGQLYFGEKRPKTCKSYDTDGWVLYCSSLSKSLAPGYRIGWVVPGRFLNKVRSLKIACTVSGTTITQVAIAHFLSMGRYEYHLKKLRRSLFTQRQRYLQGITTHFPDNVKVTQPEGGFVLWVELSKSINAFRVYNEAFKYGVSIAPGQIFSPRGMYANCLRIGFGSPYDKKADYGLQVVGSIIKKMLLQKTRH